jgi:hypothetical protein
MAAGEVPLRIFDRFRFDWFHRHRSQGGSARRFETRAPVNAGNAAGVMPAIGRCDNDRGSMPPVAIHA